ncbi:MAG: LamG-like jellyroll fold domain-containing protein, partial [Verrucomicrobiota bacterium]
MSPAANGQTTFVTGVLTLDTLRRDFTGSLGMKFTVGSSPIIITDLGRYCISGNVGTHALKLVNGTTGANVPGGSVSISLAGATAGQFRYAALASPITLAAGTSYYLVSQEISGGDLWATALRTAVTTTTVATCDGGILSNGTGWTFRLLANHPFVPLSFKYTSGAPPVNQVPLVNAGPDQSITLPSGASLSGTATDDGLPNPPGTLTLQWSKVSGPGTATFGNGNAASTTASFSQSGVYVLRFIANDSQLSATDDVTVTVNPIQNQLPTVSITNPGSGTIFTAPATIKIDANPSDVDGTISQVDFYQGSTLLGSVTAFPYSFTWSNVPAGTYSLTVKATDNTGGVATSSPVSVTVTPQSGSGLVGYWRLDDAPGTAASDSSGFNNQGSLVNGPLWTTGQIGGALSFDGVDDYISVNNSSSLNPVTQITLSAWIRPTSTAASSEIISKENNVNNQYYLRLQGGNKIRFTVAGTVLNGTTTLSANTWYLVTGTYDGSLMKVYVNGFLDATATAALSMVDNGLNVRLGARQYTTPLTFNGLIDDVRIYNRALTPAEVQALSNLTPPVNQFPVVNAGPDQTITLPSSASLSGSATDDGLPNPPNTLTFHWSQVSGPGTSTFVNANAASTAVSFSQAGTYVLRLSASDSLLSTTDDITVTVNQPPVVNAGPDQTLTLPNSATLSGSATDDGLPNPPNTLTFHWSQVSGPGTASFANANAAGTTVSFSQAGTYVLRLSASDSLANNTDDITVTGNPPAPVNQAPVVDAGPDQTITLPAGATLSGVVSDDGLPNPPGTSTAQWSQIGGLGTASFANANAASTTVTFSQPDTYVLRLKGNDGEFVNSDDITIIVNPAPNVPPQVAISSPPDNSIYTSPANITITATASDSDGSITLV